MSSQPKPDSKQYTDLISEIEKGQIKVPKFQRNFCCWRKQISEQGSVRRGNRFS